jgi:hypothetical protein
MKNKFYLLPFAILVFAMALPLAKAECVAPPDPSCSQCSGLPSGYVGDGNPNNFKYETCLDTCQNDNILLQIRYENCVFREQQQASTNTQGSQAQPPITNSKPSNSTQDNPNPNGLQDEVHTVADLKVGAYVKSSVGKRVTVVVPEGKIILDENSSIQKLKDGWKLTKGKIKLAIKKLESQHFKVKTTWGAISVRGTQFLVEIKGGKTIVRVLEGVVDVTDKQGKNKVEVKTGFQTSVKARKKPTTPQPFDLGSLEKWYEGNPNE